MESYNNNILRVNLCQMIEDNRPSGCGYCKDKITNIRKQTSYKYRLILKSIPVDIYEEMFEKGWTRCGDIVYLTIYEKTCCKLYQPRLNINNFKLNNEQKKIMKRFKKFISGEYEQNKLKIEEKNKNPKIKIEDSFQNSIYLKVRNYCCSQNFVEIIQKFIDKENDLVLILNKVNDVKVRRNTNKKFNFNYSCDLIFIIVKMLDTIRKNNEKNKTSNIIMNDKKEIINILYKNFIEYYMPIYENVSINEETGHINFQIKDQEKYKIFLNQIEELEKKNNSKPIEILNYNINNLKINNNVYNNDNNKTNNYKIGENGTKDQKKKKEKIPKEKYIFDYFPELVNEPEIYLPLKHNYSIELTNQITLSPTEERFLIYNKYQRAVHNENSTLQTYNNNWGLSIIEKKKIPLPEDLSQKTKHPELYPEYYGTYNLVHRIDGKIIAVTVIDIMPKSLESVYCYYDPDYSFLDLGVFTVIREIEYLKSFQNLINNNMIYYSMGEMCQSCQKLRYKGNYFPTEIMDHYTGNYVLLTDEVKQLIGDNKCHHLAEGGANQKVKFFDDMEIEDKFWNFIVDIYGEKVFIEDFFSLYIQNENYKNILISCIRRFLQIIDKELYSKIEFYFDSSVFEGKYEI